MPGVFHRQRVTTTRFSRLPNGQVFWNAANQHGPFIKINNLLVVRAGQTTLPQDASPSLGGAVGIVINGASPNPLVVPLDKGFFM